ncbi:hypothetical protein K2X33_10760 [bacterium]|nr:hypothetical protein [bacterium]
MSRSTFLGLGLLFPFLLVAEDRKLRDPAVIAPTGEQVLAKAENLSTQSKATHKDVHRFADKPTAPPNEDGPPVGANGATPEKGRRGLTESGEKALDEIIKKMLSPGNGTRK